MIDLPYFNETIFTLMFVSKPELHRLKFQTEKNLNQLSENTFCLFPNHLIQNITTYSCCSQEKRDEKNFSLKIFRKSF